MSLLTRTLTILTLALTITACGSGDSPIGVDSANLNFSGITPSNSVNDGNVSYINFLNYKFDETEGSTVFNSGSFDLNGEIKEAIRVRGITGNALDFSTVSGAHVLFDLCCYTGADTQGGNSVIAFPDNTFSISVWLKPTDMAFNKIYPIFGGSYWGPQTIKMRINQGVIELLLYREGIKTTTLISGTSSLNNGEWTHIAITYDGLQATIYVDGIAESFNDLVMPIKAIDHDFYIGGIPDRHPQDDTEQFGEYSFPGLIDEFILSIDTFSEEEVKKLAN